MAGRTPNQAVQSFLRPLRLAISCVSNAVWDVRGGYDAGRFHAATLQRGNPVRLVGNPRLFFRATINYRIIEAEGERGPWKVSTAAYQSTLEDRDGRELISYQWHPELEPSFPHLHLGPITGITHIALATAHMPTGRIALEDILRLAIEELGVTPIRNDWSAILKRTKKRFDDWRTW